MVFSFRVNFHVSRFFSSLQALSSIAVLLLNHPVTSLILILRVMFSGEFIRNLVKLESGGSGGVVWRIRASETKLVCAVGSRNGTEETKLLVLDFDVEEK